MMPDKIYVPQDNIEAGTIQELGELTVEGSVEYIRKGTIYKMINKRLQELWSASSSQADNDEYYKNPLVKQLKGLINEIESL